MAGNKVAVRRLASFLEEELQGGGVSGWTEGAVGEGGGLGRLGREELGVDLVLDFFTGSRSAWLPWGSRVVGSS